MALYRFSAKMVSRADGRSATAAAAYRAGEEIVDRKTGAVHDYTRRSGVVSSWIQAPARARDWVHDRAALWNAVEAAESRKDSQLAREIQLALPHELTVEQQRELVQSFVAREFTKRGMVADIAHHAPDFDRGDSKNWHAHIMLTTRKLDGDGDGFSEKKERAWNSRTLVRGWRERWAGAVNAALEAAGSPARVDHRTLEAQAQEAEDEGDTVRAEELRREAEAKAGVVGFEDYLRAKQRGAQPRTERGRRLAAVREERAVVIELAEAIRQREAERAAEAEAAAAAAAAAALEPQPEPDPAPRPRRVAGLGIGRQILEAARAEAATAVARPRPAPVLAPVEWVPPGQRLVALDQAIEAEAARLLALQQERERQRLALEAWRRSVEALRAEQARLGSRLRAWLGLQAGRGEQAARAAMVEARTAGKAAGLVGGLAGLAMPAAPAAIGEIERRLSELRQERAGVIEAAASWDRRQQTAAEDAVAFALRAAAVVPSETRADWACLRALDALGGDPDRLRLWLVSDGSTLSALAVERDRRGGELAQLEQDLARVVRHDQDDDDQGPAGWPAPGM